MHGLPWFSFALPVVYQESNNETLPFTTYFLLQTNLFHEGEGYFISISNKSHLDPVSRSSECCIL
jgi:hypothetical protein